MLEREIKISVEPTIEELAEHVSALESEDQAEFLNLVAKEFNSWTYSNCVGQIYNISESKKLTDEAKSFVKLLNTYINDAKI